MNEIPDDVLRSIEGVVTDLDFYRIREAMKYLDWSRDVPTQKELYDDAMDLLCNTYLAFNDDMLASELSANNGLVARCDMKEGRYIFHIGYEVASASNVE